MGYKGIDEDIIKNPEDPRYESRRVENKIDYLIMSYLRMVLSLNMIQV